MAAATIPRPGTKLGPCAGLCVHTDCALSRAMALIKCRICTEPIGFERRFYAEGDDPSRDLVHASCLEDETAA